MPRWTTAHPKLTMAVFVVLWIVVFAVANHYARGAGFVVVVAGIGIKAKHRASVGKQRR
jgi:hypothetical protein